MTLQQAGGGSPSRAFHWAGVHEYRKKGAPCPAIFRQPQSPIKPRAIFFLTSLWKY